MKDYTKDIYKWAEHLFPINRSLSGKGVRETLNYIKLITPSLKIKNFASNTKVFDWKIPKEWNVNEAYIKDPNGKKIIDYKSNNLHLVGYSIPINKKMNLQELKKHLYSDPKIQNAIPYVTSYYNKIWGFCISHKQKKKLKKGIYKVFIDTKFSNKGLDYGELLIRGKSKKEILISTNICHPSMANNEISGIVVATSLAKKIYDQKQIKKNNYSYRFLFLPETIGSIAYLSKNFQSLKKNVIAGFVVVCVGGKKEYSYLESRYGNTLADKATKTILNYYIKKFKTYSFLERGSDERQFCSPGIDLPVCSIMRTKYATYKEYHNSLDNLNFISKSTLIESHNLIDKILKLIEINKTYVCTKFCEPFMSKYNLYPKLSFGSNGLNMRTIMNLLAYSDGTNDLIDISIRIKEDPFYLSNLAEELISKKLIKEKKLK